MLVSHTWPWKGCTWFACHRIRTNLFICDCICVAFSLSLSQCLRPSLGLFFTRFALNLVASYPHAAIHSYYIQWPTHAHCHTQMQCMHFTGTNDSTYFLLPTEMKLLYIRLLCQRCSVYGLWYKLRFSIARSMGWCRCWMEVASASINRFRSHFFFLVVGTVTECSMNGTATQHHQNRSNNNYNDCVKSTRHWHFA